MTNEELRQRGVESARSYLNVGFSHQGRTHMGVDCVGLVICSLVNAGYKPECPELFYKNDHNRLPSTDELVNRIEAEANLLASGNVATLEALSEAQPLDLIAMAYRPETRPRHVALVTEGQGKQVRIIHTNNETRMVKEHLLFPSYSMFAVSLYRLKQLCTEAP